MSSEKLRQRAQDITQQGSNLLNEAIAGRQQVTDVMCYLRDTRKTLDDLSREFKQKTELDARDQAIMFVAIALQIARQYLLTEFPERHDDQTEANNTFLHGKEHSNRKHRLYNPSLQEVITNPVPFDANIGSDGALSGGGKLGHRVTTIGHDPILGLIFGTANIATSTLTTSAMQSFHIYTEQTPRGKRDVFTHKADTGKVLTTTKNKLLHGDMENKTIVAASLVKELVHLRSDLNTIHSLPLPLVSSTISPSFASDLALRGLDMCNTLAFAKQIEYSMLINTLIAMFHGLFYDGPGGQDRRFYEVRTRKILSYSNLVASSSNIAVVAVTQDFKKLDLGGLAVTLYQLITNERFIAQVKYDFLYGSYFDMLDAL